MPEHSGADDDNDNVDSNDAGKQRKYDYIDFMSKFVDTPAVNGHMNGWRHSKQL